eukprot:3005257-Prymnesium_polylepis.1
MERGSGCGAWQRAVALRQRLEIRSPSTHDAWRMEAHDAWRMAHGAWERRARERARVRARVGGARWLSTPLQRGSRGKWQSCGNHVAIMWRSCGNHVAIMWQSNLCSGEAEVSGNHVTIMWQSCGDHVAIMWQSCGDHTSAAGKP